ncbi:MAG: hypothetical protein HWE09_07625 [Cyclobacteriaceae bacterium]|nr:hypothetical protein [Cyclobacteriaceae bacterium]
MKNKLKRTIQKGTWILVLLLWGTYLYEILFTSNSQFYGVKEWGLFGILTFWLSMDIWTRFEVFKKSKK